MSLRHRVCMQEYNIIHSSIGTGQAKVAHRMLGLVLLGPDYTL